MTLLEQYRSGDCQSVWRQIVDEGRRADDEEAVAVARETVIRARDNLRLIYDRLCALGYEFAEPDMALVTTTPDKAAGEIAAIEAHYGPLPGLARLWYSHVSSVNFAQAPTQCRDATHELRNLGWFPLAIYHPLQRCHEEGLRKHAEYIEWYHGMLSTKIDDFDAIEYLEQSCRTPEESARFLPLGSYASNNENKGFMLPCDLMDAEFFNDGEVTYFNEELRHVIMSGCFPNLSCRLHRERVPEFMKFGHPDPESLHAYLKSGLQQL